MNWILQGSFWKGEVMINAEDAVKGRCLKCPLPSAAVFYWSNILHLKYLLSSYFKHSHVLGLLSSLGSGGGALKLLVKC